MTDPRDKKPRIPEVSSPDPKERICAAEPKPEIEGYEILDELGAGGMGTVWRARQLSTRRDVALKVTTARAFRSDRARARFEREVELAGRLEHPHIARVYDSGLHRGAYYYAMELVTGRDLETFVREHDLSDGQILRLLHAVCLAVQYAHQRGVIHRDLKPSNILVTPDGQPHILDFGLAKDILNAGQTKAVSLDGDILGTPAYMSPEQAAGRLDDVDTRSDVYSLGVILYNLLTREWPYDVSGTYYDVLKNIQEQEPRRPSRIAPSFDMDVEAILLKALSKEPNQRYPSVAQLAEDIQRHLDGLPVRARSAATLYLVRKWVTRHKAATAVAALLAVILASATFISTYSLIGMHATNRRLQASIELRQSEREDLLNMLHYASFDFFLKDWHADAGATGPTLHRLAPGSREQKAAQWLLDPRPLDQKVRDIQPDLAGEERHFWHFVLGECCLKRGDKASALEAYQRCLQSDQDSNEPGYWYLDKARRQTDELRIGGTK